MAELSCGMSEPIDPIFEPDLSSALARQSRKSNAFRRGKRVSDQEELKHVMTLDEVKYEVALGSRIMTNIGLADGINASMGHVSLRDPSDPKRFVVKGRGYDIDVLARMRPEDMVVCDLNGYLVDGPPGVLQCNEVMIHACVLRARPEINSVVHAHPPFCVMLTVLGIP